MDIFCILNCHTIPNSNVTPDFKNELENSVSKFFMWEDIKLLIDGKHNFYTKSQNDIKHFSVLIFRRLCP